MSEQNSFFKGVLLASVVFLLVIYIHFYDGISVNYFFASRETLIDALIDTRFPSEIPFVVHQQILDIVATESKQPNRSFPESADPAFWTTFEQVKKAQIIEAAEKARIENEKTFFTNFSKDDLLISLAHRKNSASRPAKNTRPGEIQDKESLRATLLNLAKSYEQTKQPK